MLRFELCYHVDDANNHTAMYHTGALVVTVIKDTVRDNYA
jgi:hypothetical protein